MVELAERLEGRRAELEQATLARLVAIADPSEAPDPAYLDGLRAALAAAVDYGLAAIRESAREPGPVPVELLAQARRAARNSVSLEAILRRYAAGHSLLADGFLEEAGALGIDLLELKKVLRGLATRYDRIVAAVSDEYERELSPGPMSPERSRAAILARLLGGEPLVPAELGYSFDAHHLAIVGSGPGAEELLASLARQLDRCLLLAAPGEGLLWACLGGRREFDQEEIELIAAHPWPSGTAFACGAPGHGISGWRISHRQACSALAVAHRRHRGALTTYAEVAMVSAILRDGDLVAYLTETYLTPLEAEDGRAETLQGTLRAYFATDCNAASAASVLGVARQTVTSRLRTVEERLDRLISSCRLEIEAALVVAEFGGE